MKDKCIAVDIGGTRIKISIVKNGKVEKFATIPAHSEGKLSDRLPEIESVIKELAGDLSQYFGIGFSLPCLVDSKGKRATEIYGKFEDLPSLDLVKYAKDKFSLPLILEQDSKLALLGEAYYGCAKGYSDIVLVIMGTGVGTAVMLDGKLLGGKRNFAGALSSHIIIEQNGRKCACNGRGCLEAYTSTWALPSIIKEHGDYSKSVLYGKSTLGYKELKEAVLCNDKVATDVFNSVITAMRAGLLSLIHAYAPEVVVFSGGPLNMGEMFTKPLFDGINEIAWGKENVKFLIAQNPDVSVALGIYYMLEEERNKNGEL